MINAFVSFALAFLAIVVAATPVMVASNQQGHQAIERGSGR